MLGCVYPAQTAPGQSGAVGTYGGQLAAQVMTATALAPGGRLSRAAVRAGARNVRARVRSLALRTDHPSRVPA